MLIKLLTLLHLSLLPAAAQNIVSSATIDVRSFGAKCDWNGTTGTDDSVPFQSAVTAAGDRYTSTSSPVSVRIPDGCKIAGQVNLPSGVRLAGPGSIFVPLQNGTAATTTFFMRGADNVAIENLQIKVITNTCGNNAACSVIRWESVAGDTRKHKGVYIRNNTIIDSAWGILIRYATRGSSGSLSDIDVSGNTVESTNTYTNSDAIHVAGRVSGFTISNNRILGRGDAAIAVSSEPPFFLCAGGIVNGNILLNNLVGIDDAGCSNLNFTGNFVQATLAPPSTGAWPAFRSFTYLGNPPANVSVVGNSFYLTPRSTDPAAKIDMAPAASNSAYSVFTGNTLASLYLRGSHIAAQGNTFLPGASLVLDYDSLSSPNVPSSDNIIGTNSWLGTGKIIAGGNAAFLLNNLLLPQLASGTISYINPSNFVRSCFDPDGNTTACHAPFTGTRTVGKCTLEITNGLITAVTGC